MSHSPDTTVSPQTLAEADAAYAALRTLLTSGTPDLAALHAARARFATAADAVAEQCTGAQRRLWLNHATRVCRELREVRADVA